jgi:hypothetical protein
MTSDVSGATTIYYLPYVCDTLPLWNGALWVITPVTFASVSIAGQPTGKPYDVFGVLSGNALALEVLAWTDDTTRATSVAFNDGRWVKSTDKSRLLLGTFYTTDSSTKRYLANVYNRVARPMLVTEATASWTYTGAMRQANGSTANQLNFVISVADQPQEADVLGLVSEDGSAPTRTLSVGVGLDSTTTASFNLKGSMPVGTAGQIMQIQGAWRGYFAPGRHFLAWLERASGAGTVTWYGTNASAANFQAGIRGVVWQ